MVVFNDFKQIFVLLTYLRVSEVFIKTIMKILKITYTITVLFTTDKNSKCVVFSCMCLCIKLSMKSVYI